MSVKVAYTDSVNVGGINQDLYGLPVQDGVTGSRQSNRSRNIIGGIRVPNLRDLNSKYVGRTKPSSCRFDIVERVETVVKPGDFGPEDPKHGVTAHKFDHSKDSGFQKMAVARQQKFHESPRRSNDDKYIVDRLGPYHWNKYVKHGRERDARDVLYRNTYCMDREELRYRSLTLPRISQDKTLTIETKDMNRSLSEKSDGEHDHVIIPKQPRGTVVRFREYMRPATYGGEGRSLEIKRFKSQVNQINHFTAIRNVFPMIRQDSRISSRRSDRPLKFENSRYTARSSKGTLFNKHIYPAYKNAFMNRDYSSADTFKEYLDSLQQNGVMKPNYDTITRENTRYDIPRSADYENQVLQSVQEVNKPNLDDLKHEDANVDTVNEPIKDNRSQITVEIKPSWAVDQDDPDTPRDMPDGPEHLDNISSVHGSVRDTNNTNVAVPKTSSVIGSRREEPRSIVGSIPNEDNGSLCPANTPTPEDQI